MYLVRVRLVGKTGPRPGTHSLGLLREPFASLLRFASSFTAGNARHILADPRTRTAEYRAGYLYLQRADSVQMRK